MLKEGSSIFESNMIPQSTYEAPNTTQFGYATLVQLQYPKPCNPTPKLHEAARISAFGPFVVPDPNQIQIASSPTIVPQNGNRASQYERQFSPMSPTKNKPVRSHTATNNSTQQTISKRSSVIEVRFKEEKFTSGRAMH